MKFRKSIVGFLIISVCLYVILTLLGDINSIKTNIQEFNWIFLAYAVAFFVSAIGVRIIRWNFWFSKVAEVPFKASAMFYLSGLTFSVTPARIGEAIRSYFIKKECGITQSKTVPLVLIERFYDLTGLIIMILLALIFVDFNKIILVVPVVLITGFYVLGQRKNLIKEILSRISNVRILSRFAPNAEESSETIFQMMTMKNFVPSSLLGAVITFLDIIGALMIASGLHVEINLAKFILVISTSVIGGAISFIPGGLGVEEGGLLGLLTLYGVGYSKALVFMILYRATSTIVLTVIGIIALRKISKKAS